MIVSTTWPVEPSLWYRYQIGCGEEVSELNYDGIIAIKKGVLAYLELHEHDYRETIYQPTEHEIHDFCEKHNLNFEKLMSLIQSRPQDIIAFLVIGDKFREQPGGTYSAE